MTREMDESYGVVVWQLHRRGQSVIEWAGLLLGRTTKMVSFSPNARVSNRCLDSDIAG